MRRFIATAVIVALSASAARAAPGLEDVQVGEKALQTRIALICDGPCQVGKSGDGAFRIDGASAEMTLDLAARSRNIEGFDIVRDGAGSLLSLRPRRHLEYSNVKPCVISDRAATCIDLFFVEQAPRAASIATPSVAAAPAAPPPPGLREAAPDRLSRFAGLAPPERLEPPPARLASIRAADAGPQSPAGGVVEPSPAALRETRPAAAAGPRAADPAFDYRARVNALLGKDLTAAHCEGVRAILQNDPWALEEMVDVGLCAAAEGDGATGEEILARLLEYTPDNYEAYVGRALIALEAGEKSVARRYFQNALDAPPPIEESSRIVAAMRGL